jgi:hypothetical protein
MPKASGTDLISSATEKYAGRLFLFSSAAILAKAYDVPLSDLELLKVKIPAGLFDTALIVVIAYFAYSLLINWAGDLIAFRTWYSESSIWSQFGTNMKLDKKFISGGLPLLIRLHELDVAGRFPASAENVDDVSRQELNDFKTNAELYAARLEAAGLGARQSG